MGTAAPCPCVNSYPNLTSVRRGFSLRFERLQPPKSAILGDFESELLAQSPPIFGDLGSSPGFTTVANHFCRTRVNLIYRSSFLILLAEARSSSERSWLRVFQEACQNRSDWVNNRSVIASSQWLVSSSSHREKGESARPPAQQILAWLWQSDDVKLR